MFENKKIFVFGMARSGYEISKLLLKKGCMVLTVDAKEQKKEHVLELESLGGEVIITENPSAYLDNTFDYMVKNPGIKYDNPCVLRARELGIPVVNEVEVSYHLLPDVFLVAVTGSNGKTTTTTLIHEILKQALVPVYLGGNIGLPVAGIVENIKKGDVLLLEISDHQLCDMYDFKTNISVFTNVSPTHLDFHDSYETYKRMKMRIFNHHTKADIAILNGENEEMMELTKEIPSSKKFFGIDKTGDIYLEDDKIVCPNYLTLNTKECILTGKHNYENMMAAILVCKSMKIDAQVVSKVLKEFKGVPHRLEFVCEKKGVSIFNDSKSTNNVATITALKAFETPVLLLLGGLDRVQDYGELLPFMNRVKKVYCFGETKEKIRDFCLENHKACCVYETLKEATLAALKEAEEKDTILLSPAHASWDQYACFEDRGDEFKKIVTA